MDSRAGKRRKMLKAFQSLG
ncbi:hypothetical protein Goari_004170 [Gossypium aridum]|uniref:Uncharacterized protein n=1 Tax=Gossypium aridum TaxID=34290 RepID=A0A7J8Y445_GOSAI|nr:hypothetical protein [Gossypium aridum]